MERAPLYEWHGKEYSFGDKSADWFWALTIIAIAAIVACILFNQIILALVVLAASVTVALQAAKRPRVHRFRITEEGVEIDTALFLFKDMLHFSVLEYIDPAIPPALSIKTRSIMVPHLLIPIIGHDAEEIYDYVSLHIPEGMHDESPIDRLIEMLRL